MPAVTEQNDQLRHLLKQLQRAQFGRRSEQLDRDQMQLALEDIETSIAEQDAEEDKKDTAENPADPTGRSVAPTAARCRLIFPASTSRWHPRVRSARAVMARCTSSGRIPPSVST